MTTTIDTAPVDGIRGSSPEALETHYDLGNDFFRLWLDDSLSYTSALWEGPDDTLEQAQTRKVDYHCQNVQLQGVQRILDVGCGWGGLLKRAVDVYGVQQAVGLTLNQSHIDWIDAFNQPGIDVRLESWTSHVADAPYDRIFAWGVLEHATRAELSPAEKRAVYRQFFELSHRHLKPGGMMSVQTIVYENSDRRDLSDFILSEIFPESDLPRLSELFEGTDRLFEVRLLHNHREHYVRTLKAWHKRLRQHRAEAERLVGKETVDKYEKYLSLFMIGFHTGTMNLARLTLQRIDRPR